MSDKTGIEWTDSTWNPIRGCSRVSEGCRNCYAEKVAHRFSGEGQPYEGLVRINAAGERQPQWNGITKLVESHLLDPLKWREPRRIFVNSMSDLFHESVPDEWIDRIFAVMALAPQHTFQILTKRPERMLAYLSHEDAPCRWADSPADWDLKGAEDRLVLKALERHDRAHRKGAYVELDNPLLNVWLGVSVENQPAADARLDYLCEMASRGWQTMVSFEPLLGPVDPGEWWLSLGPKTWAIVGGESGPDARPMHPDWARSLRNQCVAAGVPFFFKQHGEYGPGSTLMSTGEAVYRQFDNHRHWVNKASTWVNGGVCMDAEGLICKIGADFARATYPVTIVHRLGKKRAGDLLDGKQWHQFPEVPCL